MTRLGNLSQMLGASEEGPLGGGQPRPFPPHLPVLLSTGRGQEARAVPKDGASARNPAPERAAHGGRKGHTCLKKPTLPSLRENERKGRKPRSDYCHFTTSSFCNCQNKKGKARTSLSDWPILHERDMGPL